MATFEESIEQGEDHGIDMSGDKFLAALIKAEMTGCALLHGVPEGAEGGLEPIYSSTSGRI